VTCTVQRKPLATALSELAKVSKERRLRLRMTPGFLHMSATDGRTWLHLHVDAKGELADVCVSGARLSEAINSLGADLIGIQVAGASLKIAGGAGNRTLPTLPVEDFPDPEFHGRPVITLHADQLREVLEFTLPHVPSQDDLANALLAGVYIFTADGKIRAIGTDKKEFALIDVGPAAGDIDVTIPGSLAEIAARLTFGEVEISASDRSMEFRWAGGVLRGQLLDARVAADALDKAAKLNMGLPGTFPVEVEAKALLAAVQGVRGLGDKDVSSNGKRICMTLNGSAVLSASSQDGEAEESFAADLSEAGEVQIGFSSSRMDRILRGFGDRVLTMTVGKPDDPLKFEAAGQPDRVALLFPMKI
jgi:DNA polymerase III sliding clamp (beta) subunit (PCNA family)